ncbi:MAG TPA: hypothetical protein VGE09_08340 [Pseudoxanthomonas sp.]
MPDSYMMQTKRERLERLDRCDFWDTWDGEVEQLDAIQMEALGLLSSLDALRSDTYRAAAVEEIDFFAADFAGTLYDLISNRVGAAKSRGDEINIGPEWIDCERAVFAEQVDMWMARAKARRAEKVYMTAGDLGIAP